MSATVDAGVPRPGVPRQEDPLLSLGGVYGNERRRSRPGSRFGRRTQVKSKMTLTSDGGPCVDALQAHGALAARREKSGKRLADVRAVFKKCSTIKATGLAIFCAGSLARMEAGDKSDLDIFVTADGDGKSHGHLFKIELFSALMALNRNLGFPPFSNDGEYLKIYCMNELKSETGSRFDDSENLFTARMLLILESQPVVNVSTYGKHIHEITKHYYRDRNGTGSFRPLFLLNDLLRYWRTLCLNYEAHRHDPDRPFRKKNVNLRFSRMLTVFGTVLPLVRQPIDTVEKLEELCKKTPLDRLAAGLDMLEDSKLADRWRKILNGYADFLSWKESANVDAFLTENKSVINERAAEISAFLYDALTHETIQPEIRRALLL